MQLNISSIKIRNTLSFILFILCFGMGMLLLPKTAQASCETICTPGICEAPYCDTCPGCPTPSPQPGEKSLGFFEGIGKLGEKMVGLSKENVSPAAVLFTNFLSKTIGIMTVIAFIWFVFTLFIGAIAWLGSGGDKTKLQNAQKQITNGLIGLLIVISAIFLIKLIGTIFGINILDIGSTIVGLWPKE